MEKLNAKKKIIKKIATKTHQKESSIKVRISELASNHPGLTWFSKAYLYAKEKNVNILSLIPINDRKNLPSKIEVERQPIKVKEKANKQRQKIPIIFAPYCDDLFVNAHFNELNKSIYYGCFTSATILSRKIIENRLIEFLRKHYSSDVTLYFNSTKNRMQDFNTILTNLQNKSKEFGPDQSLINSLVTRCHKFREQANGNTHSFFEIVRTKKEFESHNTDQIFSLLDKVTLIQPKKL
ncbi:MAG: hypothetical protein Q7S92_03905 [Candidatus Diapherotrites archaeon]|nr:hypothetical protein [Candidatus Diapherotrites archaeon]